jgi:hypothetical protein
VSARGAEAAGLPEAGGLTALPPETAEPVPLASPGFEEGLAGWVPAKPEGFSVAAGAGHAGKAALRFDCGQTTKYVPSLRQPLAAAGPGVYRLRFWIKTQDVGTGGKTGGGVRASIEYQRAGGERAWHATAVLQGTQDWQPVELSALVPPEMKPGSLTVSISRYGTPGKGEALFDDFALERLVPPPVEAFLEYPNYRGYLPADGPQRIRLWVRANDAQATGPVTVEARAADGRVVATAQAASPPTGEVVELDAAAWPPGRYVVAARLGAHQYPAYAVQKITAEERQRFAVWFDARQVLHLGGKPAFPLGLYNTTVKFPTVDDGELARLAKMAEAPVNFNINYFVWANDLATRRLYLAEMQKHGIWFLDTVNNVSPDAKGSWDFPILRELLPDAGGKLATQDVADRYLSRLGEAMRDVPGHAGWYVMDERDFGQVPRCFHQYEVLRRADPGHPTFGVSNRPDELARWRDTVDILGLDPYPLMNMKAGRPLSLVAEWTRAGVEATRGRRPVWMVLQFFQGWSTDRWPTEEELRTMSLMAVTEGARGLFYWSFGNRALLQVSNPQVREEYWQRLVKVMKEMKSLEPALVADDAPQAVQAVSDPRVRWRARLADGKCYVFAYLPSEKFVSDPAAGRPPEGAGPPLAVTFTLAGGRTVTRQLRPDFADWFAMPVAR